jgi:hypothetical protein
MMISPFVPGETFAGAFELSAYVFTLMGAWLSWMLCGRA